MPKIDELGLDDVNTTYSAWYWDDLPHAWVQYLHQGKYRYFWPVALHEVITFLEQNYSGVYRIYRHDTTRTV